MSLPRVVSTQTVCRPNGRFAKPLVEGNAEDGSFVRVLIVSLVGRVPVNGDGRVAAWDGGPLANRGDGMEYRRAAVGLLVMVFAGCSSGGSDATPSPRQAPAQTPRGALAVVSATSSPTLIDKNCTDFASAEDAQAFYIEAGGPDQDLHGLDPDQNGNACDDQEAFPTSTATVGTASPVEVTAPTSAPAAEPASSEVHTTQGVVEGESGGSGTQSSCESSDPSHCD